MRIDVSLDDLTEAGLAFALSSAIGLPQPEVLEWSVIGPLLEAHHVELTYQCEPKLKLHKRRGEPVDDLSWFARIDDTSQNISETGSTALEATAKAVLTKLFPEQKVGLSSKVIARYLKTDYPLMEAILRDSTDHFVDQDPYDRNLYRIRARDVGAVGALESILEMARKVSDFRVSDLDYNESNTSKVLCSFLIKHGSHGHLRVPSEVQQK